MTYDVGDQVRLTASFADAAGTATNPTAVVLTVLAPSGTETTPSVINSATGSYYGDVPITLDGNWFYRWSGTGALVVAEEGQFFVRPRRVP